MSLLEEVREKGLIKTYRARRERSLRGQAEVPSPPITITVRGVAYKLTIRPYKTTVAVGETLDIYGELTKGVAYAPGITVYLVVDGTRTDISTVTGSRGEYKVSWTPTAEGTYEVNTLAMIPA